MKQALSVGSIIISVLLTACTVTSESPVAIVDVEIDERARKNLPIILGTFANAHGMTFKVTNRREDFGLSQTFELENRDALLLVWNPFKASTYHVSGYAKADAAKARVEKSVAKLSALITL